MLDFNTFFPALLADIKTNAAEVFDLNFQNKSFFGQNWPQTKHAISRGSLMMRTGTLRRGNRAVVVGHTIVFSNSQPYASLHNQGGTITVTAAMKRFFWYKYYQASNGLVFKVKTRAAANTARNRNLSADAAYWKSLALMKVGSKITIRQRQWIGHHPQVDELVKRNTDKHVALLNNQITQALKQR
ncbi:MAG TPA: hypothetical protein PLS07_00675 [Niabella sp.]|nr:hypothetical protein [Niabella sp.]HQW14278.1 hypothetical protein [Niabella sp.]HQX18442.1 hypothetical protein [Niabella sp.]HQX40066.1 hypothetical protein [Niabella sp.]HRB05969.1 hypothetical protein [Niabella sp.]